MQPGIKRMLAYSSIAHSGYIMMGLVAAALGGEPWLGATGVTYYVFAYSIMTIGAFGVLSVLERHEADLYSMDDLKGLASRSPWMAACLSIFLLSLAGIPPTVGFFGKFFLFSAVIKQGLFWMAIWAVLNSVISVYYYLRPLVMMYMEDGSAEAPFAKAKSTVFAVSMMAAMVLGAGLATDPIYRFVRAAIIGLF
jgi:NADH-quinone oxidoreductase subunit N